MPDEPGTQDQSAQGDGVKPPENGFPANTPLSEMTETQQLAYWKHQSRVNEQRWKNADVSPQEIASLREAAAERDELRKASLTEQEKAVSEAADAARKEGENIGAERYQRAAVAASIKASAAARGLYSTDDQKKAIADLTSTIDPQAFLTQEGDVDEAKADSILSAFAPNISTPGTGTGPGPRMSNLHQGGSAAGSVEVAKERYAEKYQKKTS